MNKLILVGNVGADAELRVLAGDNAVLNFSLATTETWTKDGVKQEKTEWHRCSLFGPRAKGLAPHILKGTKLAVEGSIEYRSYEKDGVKQYATNVKVKEVEFAGGPKNGATRSNDDSAPAAPADDYAGGSGGDAGGDDEVPF